MNFRLEFTPKTHARPIRHEDKLFLIGSCFTEQIGQKLAHHKFRVIDNPNGILFNPVSIAASLSTYIAPKIYAETDLFYHQELWGSWAHHTRFSHPDKQVALGRINESQQKAHRFLKEADWLMLTLGSAFVYEQSGAVVANCHKVPTDKFLKRLLSVEEVVDVLEKSLRETILLNPGLHCLVTISPVRHLRDGFVENNRSKATLILAVEELCRRMPQVFYFPAYELIIDDLRDYRFFAEDMVHPNYAATQYVWEKFRDTCFDKACIGLLDRIAEIVQAASHKAFNPSSNAHQKFLHQYEGKTKALMTDYPYIDFSRELSIFAQT